MQGKTRYAGTFQESNKTQAMSQLTEQLIVGAMGESQLAGVRKAERQRGVFMKPSRQVLPSRQ